MKREERYMVLKIKDLNAAVDAGAISQANAIAFHRLYRDLTMWRLGNGKPELICAVVENDWPEYKTVWQMIERRVDGVAIAAGNSTEYGWLVENGKQGDELRYRTWRDGLPEWTADHKEALRFARRIDAEKFSEEDEGAWRIVQHAWDDMPDLAPDGRTYIRSHTPGCNCAECMPPN